MGRRPWPCPREPSPRGQTPSSLPCAARLPRRSAPERRSRPRQVPPTPPVHEAWFSSPHEPSQATVRLPFQKIWPEATRFSNQPVCVDSDTLQIFHQVSLLWVTEVQFELGIVVAHDIRQRSETSVVV